MPISSARERKGERTLATPYRFSRRVQFYECAGAARGPLKPPGAAQSAIWHLARCTPNGGYYPRESRPNGRAGRERCPSWSSGRKDQKRSGQAVSLSLFKSENKNKHTIVRTSFLFSIAAGEASPKLVEHTNCTVRALHSALRFTIKLIA